MLFWQIINNKIENAVPVTGLGFTLDNAYGIPEEYLENKEFHILRTCFGIGDWGLLTPMARLLKEKYPDCKVYYPSDKFLNKIWPPEFFKNWVWKEPQKIPEIVFKNNPYIDGSFDSYNGEIYHDHYRVYNPMNSIEPLLKQIGRFWQLKVKDEDIAPELYFSKKEEDIFKKTLLPTKKYIILSVTYPNRKDIVKKMELVRETIEKYKENINLFYWIGDESLYKKIKQEYPKINLKYLDYFYDIDIRMQLLFKVNAYLIVGPQSGSVELVSRYTKLIEPVRSGELKTVGSNWQPNIEYKEW